MELNLHNTLTRKTEELKPIKDPVVTFYSCGPTVYDRLQIGNWIAFIRWDILARTLLASGYDVHWVMNITDVGHLVSDADEGEDKLEKGAQREGKTAWEVAEYYTQDFLKGLDELNISIPRDSLPKATDHIDEQINLIKKLESQGLTYVIDDGVYFETNKFNGYGKLARLNIKELMAGARVQFNEQKHRVTDFALWKFSPKGQKRDMEWESPWGVGFPGWHVECSAMAMKYLGQTLDIHAGGIDHIPVHHTNEIAQSEAATGQKFVNIWAHSNFLTVDGVKLSKSLGNSFTLQDIIAKRFEPMDFRMFALQSHYRTQTNFTWENLQSSQSRLNTIRNFYELQFQPSADATLLTNDYFHNKTKDFLTAMNDDLNTPVALRVLSEAMNDLEQHGLHPKQQADFIDFLSLIDSILGLGLQQTQKDITKEQKKLITDRDFARKQNDWKAADKIRNILLEEGIALRDTAYGQVWASVKK